MKFSTLTGYESTASNGGFKWPSPMGPLADRPDRSAQRGEEGGLIGNVDRTEIKRVYAETNRLVHPLVPAIHAGSISHQVAAEDEGCCERNHRLVQHSRMSLVVCRDELKYEESHAALL